MSGKKKHKRMRLLQKKQQPSIAYDTLPKVEIPQGNTKEDKIARKQIIKDFYARWLSINPDRRAWNPALNSFIYVKGKSINETSGQASTTFESTQEVFRLTDILKGATLIRRMPPKRDSVNQKPYSEILIMRHKKAMLVVGKQESTGEYVQYCVSAKYKK